jgi:hypothetical protein
MQRPCDNQREVLDDLLIEQDLWARYQSTARRDDLRNVRRGIRRWLDSVRGLRAQLDAKFTQTLPVPPRPFLAEALDTRFWDPREKHQIDLLTLKPIGILAETCDHESFTKVHHSTTDPRRRVAPEPG